MRIICPNCGAQYEVDDRVIPDIGRDVQCSNCGHTWFQRPPSAVATSVRRVVEDPPVSPGPAPAAERAPDLPARAAAAFPPIADDPWPGDDDDADAPDAVPASTAGAVRGSGDGAVADSRPEPEVAPDAPPAVAPEAGDAAPGTAGPGTVPVPFPTVEPVLPDAGRPALDDATRALLREEAEREAQARAAERRPPVEVQGDFGLAPLPPVSRAVQRSADLGGDTVSPVATALAAAASRRDSLPDVDSISSSLRSAAPEVEPGTELPDAGSAGADRRFRSAFLLVLLLVIVAAAIYLLAPTLADAVPGLRVPLASYVDWVNGLRATIDGALSGLAATISGG